ncbi:DUF418 domain-containing protein [Bacillus cereus]|uniref:DUF418 domain-containing protein n=1 Tax=Bacillus cereus TaxID=1396 RepID=UPI00187AFEEA|nr:DUF418 domain-containing protein [Bacillus cereus]MBE7122964.1 DUF418 domain-containing protein [Bacillus cereus]
MRENNRIESLDIIRGIALCFILFVNVNSMTGFDPYYTKAYEGIDKYFRFTADLLIQTKFYTIFSFLFGVSFYIFMRNAEEKGLNMYKLFIKRLLILYIFGLIHYFFFWFGDILHIYALIGLMLLLFYRLNSKTLLILGITLIGLKTSFDSLVFLVHLDSESIVQIQPGSIFNGTYDLQYSVNYFTNWLQQVVARFQYWTENDTKTMLEVLPDILGIFLLGIYSAKIRLFQRVQELKKNIQIIQLVSFVISMCIMFFFGLDFAHHDTYVPAAHMLYITLNGKALTVFYVTSLLVLLENKSVKRAFRPLALYGRMALTNYIGQTILVLVPLSLMYTNVLDVTYSEQFIYSAAVIVAQIVISQYWLKKYKQGPLESFWRKLTYR